MPEKSKISTDARQSHVGPSTYIKNRVLNLTLAAEHEEGGKVV